MEFGVFLIVGMLVVAVMFFLDSNPNGNDEDTYLWSNGEIIWFYDKAEDSVKRLRIRHRMSGWDKNDWEHYNCIGDNYEEDGDDIYEVSQKEVFSSVNEAKAERERCLRNEILKQKEKLRKLEALV